MSRSFIRFASRLERAGLLDEVEVATKRMNVSLKALYDGAAGRASAIAAARRVVYSRLVKKGKSVNEVARLFDRAPSGVWKLTRIGARQ